MTLNSRTAELNMAIWMELFCDDDGLLKVNLENIVKLQKTFNDPQSKVTFVNGDVQWFNTNPDDIIAYHDAEIQRRHSKE